jgi:hypothetical protein
MRFTISILVSIFALAAISANAKTAACTACSKTDQLTSDLKALNYFKSSDQMKGQQDAEAATLQLSDFSKVSKSDSNRTQLFKSLLGLVREAGLYDGESSLADILAGELKDDAGLRSLYTAYIKTAPKAPRAEYCKTRRMETSVAQDLCYKGAGMTGQDAANDQQDQKSKNCIRAFNADSCLSGH